MYVAWLEDSSNFRLHEVTYDSNFNYESRIDIGAIKNNTFGLASELGRLYAVAPTQLYKIKIDSFSLNTVLTNDGAFGQWFGASGLHQAVAFSVSAYYDFDDASSNSNAISNSTIPMGSQSIFIRIDDLNSGTFDIIEVIYNLGIIPKLRQPDNLALCRGTSDFFYLTDVENQLLQDVNQDVVVTYYESNDDSQNQINSLNQDYLVSNLTSNTKEIYVRVDNIEDHYFNFSQFTLIVFDGPNVKEVSTISDGTFLTDCYINIFNQGYFELSDIIDDILLNDSSNLLIQFFPTFSSAETNSSELNSRYFSTLGLIEELFIKITDNNGCSEIPNFFIDGNCPLTTLNLTNIRFPKYFTPNGDGFNDYWNVKGLSNKMKNDSEITIFNRYGKLLSQFKPGATIGWDGLLNNKLLTNDDYWFVFTLNNGQKFTGHFSLIK